MSIISDALRKVADKRSDYTRLKDEKLDRDLTPEIKRLAIKKTRLSILSSVGVFFIVGLAIVIFLYNSDITPSFIHPKTPSLITPKDITLKTDITKDDTEKITPPLSVAPIKKERRALPHLTLNGIIGGTGEPLAIINNKILKKGDSIYGARLIYIAKDKVTLSYRDREFTLEME